MSYPIEYAEYLTGCGRAHNLVANVKANGAQPAIKLVHPKGSEALVFQHGATVTSFKTASKQEGCFAHLHVLSQFQHPSCPASSFRVVQSYF